jgi:hypothetical protein
MQRKAEEACLSDTRIAMFSGGRLVFAWRYDQPGAHSSRRPYLKSVLPAGHIRKMLTSPADAVERHGQRVINFDFESG